MFTVSSRIKASCGKVGEDMSLQVYMGFLFLSSECIGTLAMSPGLQCTMFCTAEKKLSFTSKYIRSPSVNAWKRQESAEVRLDSNDLGTAAA